ncbi:cAMP/cGMP-stimulated cAMP/cGMP phosphodiesterase [Tieghemostelium lacteum]|uniref:3',5'-cyclic-GMP phosphodiesterase n=1 Tax=Tieghemostelium lacteum TaxID=361077 RepID=A0A152A946_TIELA|nr:cAMP/cGMP-stimulated cAMP/cGMP phosphodiesterase [Tieghemostelium lacteum]|eukprot:KYR02651.1 cAMP/cGMP-stimulated cAMP/cGMP phosphodiesterase [Tieghemostelium lacteum]
MQSDNNTTNRTIIYNYLDIFQNLLNKIGYDLNIANLFYWLKENNELINSKDLPTGGVKIIPSSTSETTASNEDDIEKEHQQDYSRFTFNLAKLLVVLVSVKTKLNILYSWKLIHHISQVLKSTIKIDSQSLQIVYNEYEVISNIAAIEEFSSIGCKGLFLTTTTALKLSVDVINTLRDINECESQPFVNFLKQSPLYSVPTFVTSKVQKLNLNSYSPTSNSSNNQNNIYIPHVVKLQETSVLFQSNIEAIYNGFFNFYEYVKQCLKVDVFLDSTLTSQYIPYYSKETIQPKEEGAFIYKSSIGPIQIGIPPETIKTSLKKNELVPQIYVLPHTLSSRGVSYSEVEFPVFFNFFIKKAASNPNFRVIMVGHKDQLDRVQSIFKESMFGPEKDQLYIRDEIALCKIEEGYDIDFPSERSTLAFRKGNQEASLEDYMIVKPYDENNQVVVNLAMEDVDECNQKHVKIVNRHGLVCFYEDGKLQGVVDTSIEPKSAPVLHYNSPVVHSSDSMKRSGSFSPYTSSKVQPPISTFSDLQNSTLPTRTSNLDPLHEVPGNLSEGHTNSGSKVTKFNPPTLGLTFLGTGHGFDVFGSTTGFIIWVNGNGILVDPPVGTTHYLQKHGLFGKTVDSVILTHCHSDHDSGILQKIIESNKITLYTTKTVNESYQRKARALTGIKNIEDFYHWIPVKIGEPIQIEGASFLFDYSYHTIPTIRFKLNVYGKTISYSSDTKYCPDSLSKLREDGVINQQRESSLRMFTFDADVIIHECGIPPIHTSVENLNCLPDSIKEKLLVVHTSAIPKSIEKKDHITGNIVHIPVKGLRIPKVGLHNTMRIHVGDYFEGYSSALRKFQLLCDSFYFRNVPPAMLYKLFFLCQDEEIPSNQMVIRTGEPCDKCYIINNGTADVYLPLPGGDPSLHPGHSPDDKFQYIGKFYSGETFGENALRKDKERLATVIARSDLDVYAIKSSDYLQLQSQQSRYNELMNSITEDIEKIQKYGLFIGNIMSKTFPFSLLNFNKEITDHIASTVEASLLFDCDSVIIKQGDLDQSLYIIEEGSVQLIKNASVFKTLGKGECFGEISLILGLPRTCTAVASSKTKLLIINYDSFQRILDKYQNLKYNLFKLVESRLEQGNSIDSNLNSIHTEASKK